MNIHIWNYIRIFSGDTGLMWAFGVIHVANDGEENTVLNGIITVMSHISAMASQITGNSTV